jgi:hypothetical protein
MAELRLAVRADKCPVLEKQPPPHLENWPVEALDQDEELEASGDVASNGDEMVGRPETITFAEMRAAECAAFWCTAPTIAIATVTLPPRS